MDPEPVLLLLAGGLLLRLVEYLQVYCNDVPLDHGSLWKRNQPDWFLEHPIREHVVCNWGHYLSQRVRQYYSHYFEHEQHLSKDPGED